MRKKTKKKYTEKDIRIIVWREGTHYYAKVGNCDVVVEGEQKWETRDMALMKAKFFINGHY